MSYLQKATEISRFIDAGFEVTQIGDYGDIFRATDNRSEDFGLALKFDGYRNEGRIKISGFYAGGYSDAPANRPAITCSQTRTSKAIAADIKRRFYPAYIKAYEEGLAALFKRRASANQERDAVETLAAAIGGYVRGSESGGPWAIMGEFGQITAEARYSTYYQTATIKIEGLPLEAARALAHAIRAIKIQYDQQRRN